MLRALSRRDKTTAHVSLAFWCFLDVAISEDAIRRAHARHDRITRDVVRALRSLADSRSGDGTSRVADTGVYGGGRFQEEPLAYRHFVVGRDFLPRTAATCGRHEWIMRSFLGDANRLRLTKNLYIFPYLRRPESRGIAHFHCALSRSDPWVCCAVRRSTGNSIRCTRRRIASTRRSWIRGKELWHFFVVGGGELR